MLHLRPWAIQTAIFSNLEERLSEVPPNPPLRRTRLGKTFTLTKLLLDAAAEASSDATKPLPILIELGKDWTDDIHFDAPQDIPPRPRP